LQEVQGLLQGAQNLLKQEKKRRDSVERQLKKAVEERSELQVSSEVLPQTPLARSLGLPFGFCFALNPN